MAEYDMTVYFKGGNVLTLPVESAEFTSNGHGKLGVLKYTPSAGVALSHIDINDVDAVVVLERL